MSARAVLAGGCFWGMQDLIRRLPGVISTRCGYSGGDVSNATYRNHGTHAEALEVIYDPQALSFKRLLEVFFQIHDPTTPNRQGNDRGTQYRSAIFVTDDDDLAVVTTSAEQYQKALAQAGFGQITTEIAVNDQFYYAEDYHQQYLHKVPNGYCGLQGTGVLAS